MHAGKNAEKSRLMLSKKLSGLSGTIDAPKRHKRTKRKPESEADIMRCIMMALSHEGHFVARANIGLFLTRDLRPVHSGLPTGFSDLFGHRKQDARAFYIEVKSARGVASKEQRAFIAAMQERGALAGFARSVEQALAIVAK